MKWRWAGRVLLGVTWLLVFHVVAVHNGRGDESALTKWLLALCCAVALTMFGVVVEDRAER